MATPYQLVILTLLIIEVDETKAQSTPRAKRGDDITISIKDKD